MTRHLVTTLLALTASGAASADFVPTVLDTFAGSGSYTIARDGAISAGGGNIAGANWAGFGASTGNKALQGGFNSASTGYDASSVYGSMSEAGGTLSLGLVVPTGALLAGGGTSASNVRVAYTGSFDLSGKGGLFFFHFASTSALDTAIGIAITSGGVQYATAVASGQSGPRYIEIAFSSLMSATGIGYSGDGSNISAVMVGVAADTGITSGRTAQLAEFGVVPTPGAAALLGAAGLVPRRRRR